MKDYSSVKKFTSLLIFGICSLLGLSGANAAVESYGDITARLQRIFNPVIDAVSASAAEASTQLQDLRAIHGRIIFAYGSSDNHVGKKIVADLPDAGHWQYEHEPSQLLDEEQLDHFNLFGEEAFLHSYDGIAPGNLLYIRDARGWRTVRTLLGDHMRETWKIGGRIWVQDAEANAAYPGMQWAPAQAPDSSFQRFTQPAPLPPNPTFLANRFLEFGGKLYASQSCSESTFGQKPFLLVWDPANPTAGWAVAHLAPDTFYSPAAYQASPYRVVQALEWGEEVSAKFGDQTGGRRPILVFSGTRRNTENSVNNIPALYVADGLTAGERRLVSLSGLSTTPPGGSYFVIRPVYREGRVFVLTALGAASTDPDQRAAVSVWECHNLDAIDHAASWTRILTARFAKPTGGSFGEPLFEILSGIYYFGQSAQSVYLPTDYAGTLVNSGYDGSGSFWKFDPRNAAPTVTRVTPSGTTHSVSIARGQACALNVNVADSSDSVANVYLIANSHRVANFAPTANTSWTLAWTSPAPGSYILQVVAEDARGAFGHWGRSFALTVTNAAPTVSITNPLNNQVLTGPAPAIGADPTRSESPGRLASGLADGRLSLTFYRAQAECLYRVEASDDLLVWSVIATNPGSVGQYVTVRDIPPSGALSRFLRLRVGL